MRGPTFLVSILLLGSVCYFGTVSAIDYDTGIEMSVVYDSETEIASVTITAPETSNITPVSYTHLTLPTIVSV